MEPDFAGYATKAGLRCSDGRTIMPNAFIGQHQHRVPLVWQHGHDTPTNVLGHAILENRDDGVFAYGFFNNSENAQHIKESVAHGDINFMSIWANGLVERSKEVVHGIIREVSLVISGANPGALIDPITVRHSDDSTSELDGEAIIYTGLTLVHSADGADEDEDDEEDDEEADEGDETIQHDALGADATVEDVVNSMNDQQKTVLKFMVGQAMADAAETNNSAAHGEITSQEGTHMGTHSVFNGSGDTETKHELTHDAMKGIVADAMKNGSLHGAVEAYALQHGIENIGEMFPDAKAISNTPELHSRRMEWVQALLSATHKTPFSRIKSLWADITDDQARAKGYITGSLKKEEFFSVAKRITTPTTIYKKQALDRDDVVDITDFDVVMWLKAEMRLLLDEEVARAILVGDGRDVSDEDKINEQCIRPIASDHELFTTTVNVNLGDASSSIQELIDAIVLNRRKWRGTGTPTMFTSETYIARLLLLKDGMGRRMYRSLDEVASELRVEKIVPVEVLEDYADIVCILVNPYDYNVGADRGGEVNLFDDFDIDYNKHKYLIETRMSGALVRLKSAIVVRVVESTDVLVTPTAPTFDPETNEVTINDTAHVVYKNAAGTVINNAGSPYTVVEGTPYVVNATPAAGYYFATSDDDSWTFEYEA